MNVLIRSSFQYTNRRIPAAAAVASLHQRFFSSLQLKDSYDNILVERKMDDTKKDGVGLITLHRPKALNALSDGLFADLIHAAKALDDDDSIGCLVVTGSTKAFAAGADISEMKDRTFDHAYQKVRYYFG